MASYERQWRVNSRALVKEPSGSQDEKVASAHFLEN